MFFFFFDGKEPQQINLYCDESCHLQNDGKKYMVLGYVALPYNRIKRIKERVKEIRNKHKKHNEIKWTKLSNWNVNFYIDLVNLFFDTSYLNFRAIVIDKSKYKDNLCDNFDEFYYKMYYQLIMHKLDSSKGYNIYLDIKDDLSQYRIDKLKEILNIKMSFIFKIQHVRSHEVEFIQLCDMFIGAISYFENSLDRQIDSSLPPTPKTKLIEHISSMLERKISDQTKPSEEKFNVFRIRL